MNNKSQSGMAILIIVLVIILAIIVIAGIYFFMPSGTSGQTGGEYEIKIQNFAFAPSTLTVDRGDKVVWTNMDSVQHTVTSDSGNELDSALLSQGQAYSHTFNTAGTFSYHCTPHPNMKATIIVRQ